MKKNVFLLVLLFIFISPSLISLFHSGFFATDDGNWMVIRLSAFYEALRSGQFPTRFLPRLNNGYGYPVADFLYPLFLYAGSAIHLIHAPYVLTVKFIFCLSFLLSGLGCFLWLKKKFSEVSSVIGSVIYTLFPYHMWDMTKRGSLGEVFAMGIAPFIFWAIDLNNFLLVGAGIGLLILAHNSLALLFLPVIVGYLVIEKKIKKGFISLILGFSTSAFFWIPALFDKQFTIFDKTTVSEYSQYFLSWDLYKLIGLISVVVIFLLLILHKKINKLGWYFIFIAFLSLFFTNFMSSIFWQFFHLGTYVQFPFRFLSVSALCVGFLGALIVNGWGKHYFYIFIGALFIIIYFSSWNYFYPKDYQYYEDSFYSTNQATTTVQNEYMPIYVKSQVSNLKAQKIQVIKGKALILSQNIKGTNLEFSINAKIQSVLQINYVYFPGWIAKIDNKDKKIIVDNSGFINLPVTEGIHSVKVWFGETPIRIFADFISFVGVFIIVLGFIFKKRFSIII